MQFFAAVLLTVAAPGSGGDDDTVQMRNGSSMVGKIQASEAAGLTLAVGRKQETIRWTDVASVQFGNAREFDAARQAIVDGKVDQGIADLQKLAADKKLRAPLHQEVLFALARAFRVKGDADQALSTWRDLAKSHPNGRYLVSGGEWLVITLLARNDPGGALHAVDDLAGDARAANADATMLAALDLLRGRVFEAQKKPTDAQTAYERVAGTKQMPPDLVAQAQLGVARALQSAGKTADATKRYKDLLETRPPPTILAGAWNGLGDAALETARGRKDADGLEEALLAYLHGIVLDTPSPVEPQEELERALAGSIACLQALADIEPNKDRKQALLDRAQRRTEELKKQFPASKLLK